MIRKYRALIVVVIGVVYAIAASIFPDLLFISEEQAIELVDAIIEAFEGAPE